MYGDASLFLNTPGIKRQDIVNSFGSRYTVFPGDVEHKTQASVPLKLAWGDKNDIQLLDDMADEGYKYVTEEDFTAKRWRWENGKLCTGNLVMMWRPLAEFEADYSRQLAMLQGRIDDSTDDFHATGERLGVPTFEEKKGKKIVDRR